MNKQFLLIPGLFALGIAAGIAVMYGRGIEKSPRQVEEQHLPRAMNAETSDHPMANAFAITRDSNSERIQALENQIQLLNKRIEEIGKLVDVELAETQETAALTTHTPSTVDTPVTSMSPAVTASSLIKAGINEELAADIVRRRNEYDMKTLELRDRASREGYLNTGRFSRELNELREQDTSLRDEIGDDYYDSYLYVNEQTNRVSVVSVMMGSPAEMSGIKDNDMILYYDDRRIFNWSELQDATSLGERGEYVNVTVLRNGQQLNLSVPRGPLGIRLGSARQKPL